MIRFAVFTDLHYDHIPDGDRRIKEFLDAVRLKNPDFIMSLGDLCYPAAENRKVMGVSNKLCITCRLFDTPLF